MSLSGHHASLKSTEMPKAEVDVNCTREGSSLSGTQCTQQTQLPAQILARHKAPYAKFLIHRDRNAAWTHIPLNLRGHAVFALRTA